MNNVARFPVKVPRERRSEEAAQRLRELADELENCDKVSGILVIIDRSEPGADSDKLCTVHTGELESRERSHWVLTKIRHRLMHFFS